jgi:hypothetical protein
MVANTTKSVKRAPMPQARIRGGSRRAEINQTGIKVPVALCGFNGLRGENGHFSSRFAPDAVQNRTKRQCPCHRNQHKGMSNTAGREHFDKQ